jgi:hypothetical protein
MNGRRAIWPSAASSWSWPTDAQAPSSIYPAYIADAAAALAWAARRAG